MIKLAMFATFVAILAMASEASAQKIGMAFDEAGTVFYIDGRTDLVPNPDLYDFPSVDVWVIAYDIPELSGYEYKLSSTDASAIVSTAVVYPTATAQNSGDALVGEVRVDTGVCFLAGSADAGPDPTHIRLAKHTFTWTSPPTVDVLYCIGPSIASGAVAPQYTECVANPASLSFGVANEWDDTCTPYGCVPIVFEWESDGVTGVNCRQREPSPAASTSWGALKAAY